MPEGHRVFAARSVLDGREHDGSLRQEGAKSISLHIHAPSTASLGDAVRKIRITGETKFRHLSAGFHRR
jgi:hypothetical protein